jgi:hypothetical protein
MLADPPLRGMLGAKARALSLVIGSIAQLALILRRSDLVDYPFM